MLFLIFLCGFLNPFLQMGDKNSPLPPDHAKRFEKGLVLFDEKIETILKNQCLSCHGGEKIRGGFNLISREKMLAGGDSGPAIIPFASEKSRLIKMVRHQENPVMPEKAPALSMADQDAFSTWVDNGAPYSRALGTTKSSGSGPKAITEKDKQFRSFRPLTVVPKPLNGVLGVDFFVNQKIKENNLDVSPIADKRTLARRAFIDLIGIPPTIDQLNEFKSDRSPDAYEKMIDRLLDSPHYGERWARHWLDVARYAESHGYEQDYDRPTAYPFRDFVIKALNQNLPYDTFLKWQIAGDEISPENPDAWFATGFLAAGVHATQITISQVEKERYDELDDIARTIGASMLGLSIHCARCHDHKYDPITIRDYYQFISIFTKTVRSEKEFEILDPNLANRMSSWEKSVSNLKALLKQREELLIQQFPNWWPGYIGSQLPNEKKWKRPARLEAISKHGSTVESTSDASIKVHGKNPTHDVIEIYASTQLNTIKTLRLQALATPGLAKNGPGRASNGNFALSDLRIDIRPLGTNNPWEKLKLINPRATFEQKGLPVSAAIDENPISAWAIDPKFGQDHSAIFTNSNSTKSPSGWETRWTLQFNNNSGHGIGNIRIAFSESETNGFDDDSEPAFISKSRINPQVKLSASETLQAQQIQRFMDVEWKRLTTELSALETRKPVQPKIKALVSSEGLPAVRLHTQGGDFLEQTHFLKRGDPNQKGDVASPSFLEILTNHHDNASHWIKPAPSKSRTPFLRKALAEWITDTKFGAGNLTARVAVNRLWHHHFGKGIIRTINDFGITGEPPTHPELLEWLASELISSNWNLKKVHKLIMTSDTYKRSSQATESSASRDPENKWLTRRTPRRLDAEAARDSLLSVAGILEDKQFGPSDPNPLHHKRAIYSTLKRSRMPTMMTLFDAPDSLQSAEERPTTTVAPQALMLLNHPLMDHVSKGLAMKASESNKDPVISMFERALLRQPTNLELEEARNFLDGLTAEGADKTKALKELGQVLVLSNEFFYAD